MDLTNMEQKALDVVRAAGSKGISFKDWQKKAGVRGNSTMRQRSGRLTKLGAIRVEKDGKFATYFAVTK